MPGDPLKMAWGNRSSQPGPKRRRRSRRTTVRLQACPAYGEVGGDRERPMCRRQGGGPGGPDWHYAELAEAEQEPDHGDGWAQVAYLAGLVWRDRKRNPAAHTNPSGKVVALGHADSPPAGIGHPPIGIPGVARDAARQENSINAAFTDAPTRPSPTWRMRHR